MVGNIEDGWKKLLKHEFQKPYFKELTEFVQTEYESQEVFPPKEQIFRAFDLCSPEDAKVVILGQDPYHGAGQAHGLCFSVNKGIKVPPSLVNIYKELKSDLGIEAPDHGFLEHWASQGVLLLNATLTVKAHEAGSHQKKGWEKFTDAVIQHVSTEKKHIVFILWGAYAGKKAKLIDSTKHLVIQSPHPSPLSSYRGFFGSKCFSRSNEYLQSKKRGMIDWQIPEIE